MSGSTTSQLIEEAFDDGAFLVLCIDPTFQSVLGMPADVGQRVVMVQLTAPPWKNPRYDIALMLPYSVGEDLEPETAILPWQAIFAIIRRDHRGTAAVNVNHPGIPAWLGEGKAGLRALGQLLAGEGLVPPEAAPGGLPWGFDVTLDRGAPPTDEGPDKRQALLGLLDTDGADRVVILLDADTEDLVLPHDHTGPTEVTLPGRRYGSGPDVTGLHVGLDVQLGGGKRLRVRIPWSAISAMQDPSTGHGWFWPAELPEAIAAPLAEQAPEAWELLTQRAAVPLEPVERPEPVWLSAPVTGDKRVALEGCMRVGPTILLVAADHPNLRTLPGLAGRPLIACASAPGTPGLSLEATGVGVRVTVPDAYGNHHKLRVPWDAVCAIGTNQGGLEVHAWPEAYPPEVHAAMKQVLAQPDGDDATPAVELAEGLTFTRTEGGRAKLELHQPLGPDAEGAGLTIDAAFVLPPE